MKHILFGIKYLLNHWITGKDAPLIGGLVLLNDCNLRCRHCTVVERPSQKLSYRDCLEIIDKFYVEGGRTLYYEGGEPMMWKDHEYRLDDVIQYAGKKGFVSNIIYTNGTFPLNSLADTIFISIDGPAEINDYLRGKAFEKIMRNIDESAHPSMYINFTINSYNRDSIEEFCAFIASKKKIKGIFFYFHTPYYGKDELALSHDQKQEIILLLIRLKSKYRILNSRAGLMSAYRNDWKRPLGICRVYEGNEVYHCCRFYRDEELCSECGYLSYAEINQVFKLKPSAMLNALKYF